MWILEETLILDDYLKNFSNFRILNLISEFQNLNFKII